ncbi:MAG: hypothetical protein AAGG01_06005 [Planctomycetota bacterium]
MRPASLALATLILGLALGGAAGFLIAAGQPGEVAAAASMVAVEPADLDSAASEARGVAKEAELVRPRGRTLEASTSDGWDADRQARSIEAVASSAGSAVAARVAAETSVTVDPTWTGVITGEVVDEAGQPVAGATVITRGVQSWYDGRVSAKTTEKVGRAYPGRRPLEEQLIERAKAIEEARLTLPQTVTDEAGQFTLSSLEHGTHSISAYAEGFVFESSTIRTGERGRVMGNPVGVFELDVRLPDGSEPASAVVFTLASDGDEKDPVKWEPGSPEVRLKSQRPRVRVMSGEIRAFEYGKHAAEFVSAPFSLDAAADEGTPREVELRQLTQLQIEVRDESLALPHVDPWVKLVRTDGAGSSEPLEVERRRSGPFIAADLAVGSYEIQVGRGTPEAESTTEVDVVAGLNRAEVVLGDMDGSGFVVLKCSDLEGRPVRDVEFRYSTKTGSRSHSGGLWGLEERPGGEYWVGWKKLLRNGGSREDAQVTITATSGTFGSQVQELDENGRAEFVFIAPCELTVSVANPPAGKLRVRAILKQEGAESERHYSRNQSGTAVVAGDGLASVGKVQPGNYRIIAEVQQSDWRFSPPVAELEVKLGSGEQTVQLVCVEMHELVVLTPDASEGTNFSLQRISDEDGGQMEHVGHKQVDGSGNVVFPGLPPGSYMLMSWNDEGTKQMEIEVPTGDVLFEAMEVNGYVITEVKAGKAGERAGLRVGDVLVGAGDRQVSGDAMFFNRLWIELSEKVTALRVLRGGREISVEMEKLSNGNNAWAEFGVSWRPTSRGR